MRNYVKKSLLELERKIYVLGGLFLDTFRRENGLIKRRIGNHVMYLDPKDSGISKTLRRMRPNGEMREPAFMHILTKETKKGMTALDLGANIGYVTLILAELVGNTGQVYALEADPKNFKILSKNINTNGYNHFVYPYHLGGSNKTGNLRFYQSAHSNLGSMHKTEHANYSVDVPVTTMDDFFKDKELPNFIKMDIEGHEVEVLEGMYQTLKNSRPPVKLLMEVHAEFYSETHSLELQLRRLLELGFKTKSVISAGTAQPDFFAKHGYAPSKVCKIGSARLERGIYTNISDEHMLITACRKHKQFIRSHNRYVTKIVRAIMIEK